jgi:quercetin dioxygenase-like cupin family protein
MKRLARWSLVGVALAGVVLAFSVAPGGATPPSGQTSVVLARGTDISNGTVPLQAGTDIAMVQLTLDPGGSTGWHSHPGGAIVVIKQGSVTAYDSIGSQCQIETHSAGDAFIERPGVVHKVVNTGTVPVINLIVFPRVPPGGAFRIDEPDPGTCPGV